MKKRPFLRLLSLVLSFLLLPAPAGIPAPKDQEQPQPLPLTSIKTPKWKFTSIFETTRDLRDFGEEKQKLAVTNIERALSEFESTGDLKKLGKIFENLAFEDVQLLAKGGQRMSVEISNKVAELRRRAIGPAMSKALEILDPGKQLTIGLLNSGNKKSGIQSDIDQTVFVIPKELAREIGVDEVKVIAEFRKQFEALTGVKPEKTGISSLNGADFYPDWRQKQTVAEYSVEADRVVDENRKDPSAYRSEGELKSQAEGRGYEALQEHHRRVRDLKMARDRVEAGGGDQRTLAALEKEIEKNSPWMEIGWDEQKKSRVSFLEDPKNRVLTSEPEKVRRFAYDGSWDNWIMFEHHPESKMKYLLRSFSEGASLLRQQVMPNRAMPFEYEQFFAIGRRDLCDRVLNEVYADMPDEKRERFRKAIDAAARDRLQHKGQPSPSGKPFTDKEIFQEYRPLLSQAEAQTYQGMGSEAIETMIQDRAKRAWEADAREMMIETLVRTAKAPAELIKPGITPTEMNKIRSEYPNATPEKLDAAVRKQFYQSFLDLLTMDHAKELTSPPEMTLKPSGRVKDLVDRVLAKFDSDPVLKAQILEIAQDAAAKRVASEPGLGDFRVGKLYEHLNGVIKAKWGSAVESYRQAKADYDSGVYTKEFVANKLMYAYAERWAHVKAQIADHFGFNVSNVHLLIPETGDMPKVEIEFDEKPFNSQKLLSNMASIGNLDSVVQVVAAYQQGGKGMAAWAAAYELVSRVPGVAHLIAFRELVVNSRPQGVIMMGSAMLIPCVGEAYTLVSLATNSVAILGNAVLGPLKDDDADKMYQGFLDKRSGFRDTERSQRPGLLHGVPLRVIAFPVATPDGKTTTRSLWRIYSREDADKRFYLWPGEYNALAFDGVLGGGAEWDAKLAEANDEIQHAPEHFEAQRASVYLYYRDKLGDNLGLPGGLDPDEEKAFPHLVDIFLARIDEWINAKGEFTGYDENVIISRRFEDPELRKKIATRAALDLVRSYQIVKSIEEDIKRQIERKREEKMRCETNGMILATDKASRLQPEPPMAEAVYKTLDERRDEARAKAPRIHVYPRVREATEETKAPSAGESAAAGEGKEVVDFVVSVLADPKEHPPVAYDGNSAMYHIQVLWNIVTQNKTEKKVSATVKVLDKNNQEIATEKDIPIGIMGKAETPKTDINVSLVEDRNYEKLPLFQETRPIFLELGEPKKLLELEPFKSNPALARKIYGFKFYRRFDAPQPDEDLRFSASPYCDTTHPGSGDPNALVKVSGKDKTEQIATFVINKPYVSFEDAGSATSRPWDPANPTPARWYSYSVLMFNQNPKVINGTEMRSLKADPKDYQEGPQAPWVKCVVEPVITWNLYDPKTRVFLDPKKESSINIGSGAISFNMAAVAMLDDDPVIQQYQPDYQSVLPDRKRKYVYKVDFGDHARYAVCAEYPDHRSSFANVRFDWHRPPGIYKVVVSTEVDGKKISAPVRVQCTDSTWERNISYARQRLADETRQLNNQLANLRPNDSSNDRGGPYNSVSYTYYNIGTAYLSLGQFAEAERAMQQSLDYARQAVTLGTVSNNIWLSYEHLTEVYLAWGKPDQYRGAREAEFQNYPQDKPDLWSRYTSTALEYLLLTGDIEGARRYYELGIQSYHGTGTPPQLPQELKP